MCVFCKIINKEIPSTVVYEDDAILAILDIQPETKGHTIVFPKTHYETIFDCPKGVLENLVSSIPNIAKGIMETHNASGVNILNNNYEVAGQSVPHIHFHIIPRYEKGELTMKL